MSRLSKVREKIERINSDLRRNKMSLVISWLVKISI